MHHAWAIIEMYHPDLPLMASGSACAYESLREWERVTRYVHRMEVGHGLVLLQKRAVTSSREIAIDRRDKNGVARITSIWRGRLASQHASKVIDLDHDGEHPAQKMRSRVPPTLRRFGPPQNSEQFPAQGISQSLRGVGAPSFCMSVLQTEGWKMRGCHPRRINARCDSEHCA